MVLGRTPSVSVLVAFRGDQWRDRLWAFVRDRWEREHPDFEIVVASDDGTDPFHKTLAYNRAARSATGDVFLLTDADTWCPPEQVRDTIARVRRGRWGRPYRTKIKLTEADTLAALDAARDWIWVSDPSRRLEARTPYWAAPPLALPRGMYEAVGGHDERLRGWGSEDLSFALSVRRIFGDPFPARGEAVHLWHARRGASGRDLWAGQDSAVENAALARRYVQARRPDAMRALIAERAVEV